MISRNRQAVSGDDEQSGPGNDALETDPIYGTPADAKKDDPSSKKTVPSDEPLRLAESSESAASGAVVKICKTCMISQRDGGNFCKKCGEELVPIRSVRDTCIGDVVGEKYTIVDELGSGGMGDVYLGLNEPLGQKVAIKFLNEKFTSDEDIVLRFLNEARSYCKVNHPNAVTLLEYGQHDDGSLYLITEFIDGESLREVVDRMGPLDTKTIASVGLQVCEVLAAAHGQDVIHRDLKPDNLMLVSGSRGRYAVKVLDFGIAKIADEDIEGPMTETGSVFGTPEFMSPEQARGATAEPRSDIYSLGVILYYMATGELPFGAQNKLAVLNQHINDEPTPPSRLAEAPGINPRLESVIMRCLSKSPRDRFDDAEELAGALEEIDWDSDEVVSNGAAPGSERDDGPAVDAQDEVEPLGSSAFDDEIEKTVDLSFESDNSQLSPSGDEHLEEWSETTGQWGEGFEGEAASPEKADAAIIRRSDTPRRGRLVALGAAATAIVVGVVIAFSGGDESSAPQSPPVDRAAQLAVDARKAAVVQSARESIDGGEFTDADALLNPLDVDAMEADRRVEYEELVERASRARNVEMRLRAALDVGDCDRAEELHHRLGEMSVAIGDDTKQLVADCEDGEPGPQAERGGVGGSDDAARGAAGEAMGGHEPEPTGETLSGPEPSGTQQSEEELSPQGAEESPAEEAAESQPTDEEPTEEPGQEETPSDDVGSPGDREREPEPDADDELVPADDEASDDDDESSDEEPVDEEPVDEEPVDEEQADGEDEDGEEEDDVALPPSEI